MQELSTYQSFGGIQAFYQHDSAAIGLPMRFSVYHPPVTDDRGVPVLIYLAGLTCTEETFMIKAGAQRWAAQHGIMLVAPDTSPRNTGIPGATDEWDFGEGAGFYLDATQAPWNRHFKMETYVTCELLEIVSSRFKSDPSRVGIFGHSMGGHGALVLALRHPQLFRSVSAFAPISAPTHCPWGHKAFSRYLGPDRSAWSEYDACELLRKRGGVLINEILVDQGMKDQFLTEQLLPDNLKKACGETGQRLIQRLHDGYDHSYYFVSSFMQDHIEFHAKTLNAARASQ